MVIGPSSGTLIFLRRIRFGSFDLDRTVLVDADRSLSVVVVIDGVVSALLVLLAVIEGLSFDGNSWYLRESEG